MLGLDWRPRGSLAPSGRNRYAASMNTAATPARQFKVSPENGLASEARVFERQRAQLVRRYAGQFVALYGGRVVGHDRGGDPGGALIRRVGRCAVLHRSSRKAALRLRSAFAPTWSGELCRPTTASKTAAPVADVTVAHPVTGATRGVARGKLDTGAGLSIIPERLVGELALSPHGQIWARSYDGASSRRQVLICSLRHRRA